MRVLSTCLQTTIVDSSQNVSSRAKFNGGRKVVRKKKKDQREKTLSPADVCAVTMDRRRPQSSSIRDQSWQAVPQNSNSTSKVLVDFSQT